MSGFQNFFALSAFQRFFVQYVLFFKIGCHVENSAKDGGKQLSAEFTVQEDTSTRKLPTQVVIFNLLLLDNVNAQVF